MTIPTERTRPMPQTYERAARAAIEARQSSITMDRGTQSTFKVEINARFWIAEGFYTEIGGKGNRYVTFTIGLKAKSNNLAYPELNMKRVFASHTELVAQLV